jgi:hypothetical protein
VTSCSNLTCDENNDNFSDVAEKTIVSIETEVEKLGSISGRTCEDGRIYSELNGEMGK